MGYPMAVNLRKGLPTTHTLLICDISPSALDKFQSESKTLPDGGGPVRVIRNGAEAVQQADMVITMLPDSAAVKAVYLDAETGILAGAERALGGSKEGGVGGGRNIIIMECGTIDPSTIHLVASSTTSSPVSNSLAFLDAPVSGGPMGAIAGNLTFMVGSPDSRSFETAKSYLSHMGAPGSIFACGPPSAGTSFKIINNYLSAITTVAASEALNIGAKLGLDMKLLSDVINVSGGQCWVTSKANPVPGVMEGVPSSRDYEGGFRIELCAKVLGMGSELAKMSGAKTVLDGPTLGVLRDVSETEGFKGKDARIVYKWLNEKGREEDTG